MKVALIGASGHVGSRILAELARRGHQVTAIVRNPEKVAAVDGVQAVKGDVYDRAGLSKLLAGHDAAVVGGAGSLEVAPGVKLIDTPEFPAIYLDEAKKGGAFLDLLRGETALNWTFLSPSALIQPGERTGKFRLGTDQLLVDEKGNSAISTEDYAVALVDELEQPKHERRRFTVGY